MSPAAQANPRSLAGATILQVLPALRDDPASHAAVDIAFMLLQSGARAIIASDDGPLVSKLGGFGGEWLPMINETSNPLRIRQNARRLTDLISGERIDIVHAQSAGGAWSAIAAARRMPAFLVTSFPIACPHIGGRTTGFVVRSRVATGSLRRRVSSRAPLSRATT